MNFQKQDFSGRGNRDSYGTRNPQQGKPNWDLKVKTEWITNEIDRKGIEFSKEFGEYLANNKLTTSQIRNIYGELKRIQMKGFENEKTSFLLLLPKMAYAAQRNKNDGLSALKSVFEKLHAQVSNKKDYNNMMDLMESILAYHKAFGGRDN
jgi:CRISPR-associated protein Csm2